ncbi:MAG TPA: VOC family protein [Steroidobacteraceae bacterium]
MNTQPFGPIRQIAWVVKNLEESVANWLRVSGLGPWTVFRNVAMAGTLDGQAARVRMHVALGYQGDMEIELIEDLGAGASPYRSPAGEPLVGMHHVAWFSDDVAADVARGTSRGMEVKFAAANEVTRVAYLSDPHEPKLLFEFIEMNAVMRAGFAARLEASRTWQGENPLQVIDLGG